MLLLVAAGSGEVASNRNVNRDRWPW